jgi:hypothetical protein
MTTYLDTIHFETYVSACAARAGVSVEWDAEGTIPRTNGKRMWIPRINSTTDPRYLTTLRTHVKHETSHITHTQFEYWKGVGAQGLLGFIINLLEDNRIDYLNDHEYLGDKALSNAYYEDFAAKVLAASGDKASEQQAMLAPLFMWDGFYRDWIASMPLVHEAMQKHLDADGTKRLDTLCSGTYGDELVALRTSKGGATTDLLTLAERILREVYGVKDVEQYKKPEKGSGKGKGEGKGTGEDGEGDAEGDGKGEGKGKSSDKDEIITIDDYIKKMGGEHIISRTGIACKKDTSTERGGYTIPSKSDYHVRRWPEAAKGMPGYLSVGAVENIINNSAKPLSNALRMKLQVRSKGRYEYGTKTGKLHTGSLHRLVSARGTAAESRVFRKHVTSDTLDTAVSVLVDCSGSMSGSKFDTASAAAISVALALKPLHIPFNILGFTNTCGNDDPIIWVFNDWNENVTQPELIKRFVRASGELFENTDGDAVAWANNYLVGRKEKRKLLLVMSDGSPAGRTHAGAIGPYTKKVVSDIEKRKEVEIYGVGIMDTNVCRYYTKHCVINNNNELTPTILSILDKAI